MFRQKSVRQVALLVADGGDDVLGFLRHFVLFLKKKIGLFLLKLIIICRHFILFLKKEK